MSTVLAELVRGDDLLLWPDGARPASTLRDQDTVHIPMPDAPAAVRAPANATYMPRRHDQLPAVPFPHHEVVRMREERGPERALLARAGESQLWYGVREAHALRFPPMRAALPCRGMWRVHGGVREAEEVVSAGQASLHAVVSCTSGVSRRLAVPGVGDTDVPLWTQQAKRALWELHR